MEEIILERLSSFSREIGSLSDKSLNLYSDVTGDNLKDAKIIAAKLQAVINSFQAELFHYFKISSHPDSDAVSGFTTIQIQGEQTLAELKINIESKSAELQQPKLNKTHAVSSKLPKLNLPEYDGDVLEWHQFWDQFSSNIDTRNLPDVDKLLYLKASLKGQARQVVDGLDTTNKNYQISVSTLKERYGKESLIVDAHYSALYRLKPAEKTEECRKTLNDIERHLRVLNSLGEDTSHNHLRFLIAEKFPENIIYEMKMKTKEESIEEIRKQLDIIISAREDASRMAKETNANVNYTVETLHVKDARSQSTRNSRGNRGNHQGGTTRRGDGPTFQHRGKRRYEPTRQNYAQERERDNKRKRFSCIFCDGPHFNDQCTVAKTPEERKGKLKDRCYVCLKRGHQQRSCFNKKKCVHCEAFGLHHRALCPKGITEQPKAPEPTNI